MSKISIDVNTRYAVEGRIVTMDEQSSVLERGVLYVEGDTIIAVRDRSEPPPAGFTKRMIIRSGGTVYPGLIELHNHLSYNILPQWQVPKTFVDRNQWRRHPDYPKLMTGPLKVLGSADGSLQAIVRYVECKLLFSGVTSSQGVSLASHGGIRKHFKGVVRNVDQVIDPDLRSAQPRIADVKDAERFKELLARKDCYLLHLAEGTQGRANKHFRALQINESDWAITPALAGIHAVGLLPEDFATLKRFGGSMVWSPMSNLLLYGVTADIAAAQANDLLIGIGSDWSLSGSRNLLCELKVAKLCSAALNAPFTDEQLVRMATTNAAQILKWQATVGTLEAGKKADLIVVNGRRGDPYAKLIEARETSVSWVIVDGVPRCGQRRLMQKFDVELEKVKLDGSTRYLNLADDASADNPIAVDLTYSVAVDTLTDGLGRLPTLARQMENASADDALFSGAADLQDPNTTRWSLNLEHVGHDHDDEEFDFAFDEGSIVLSEVLEPIELDRPIVSGDRALFEHLSRQRNLPDYVKLGLPPFYGERATLPTSDAAASSLTAAVRNNLGTVQRLAAFRDTPGRLTTHDRLVIVDQAIVLLDQVYVHRPLKRARHAANPVEQLQVLRHRLLTDLNDLSELAFHSQIISIFNQVRDLHTAYHLPRPFRDRVAFLPFAIEEYFAGGNAHFTVSKIIGRSPTRFFSEGVEITHWNNVPIARAVENNGLRYAGSNRSAQRERGLDALTFRPLASMLPPQADAVTLGYRSAEGRQRQITFQWLVGDLDAPELAPLTDDTGSAFVSGYDYQTQLVQNVKKRFFAASVIKAEQKQIALRDKTATLSAEAPTTFPGHFRIKTLDHNGIDIGYIRIFSFATRQPQAFVDDFCRMLKRIKSDFLILDVRNNGGGNIRAAEWMLEVLAGRPISAEPAQFLNTPLINDICRWHSPSSKNPTLDLTPWRDSFAALQRTGAVYSLGYPITPPRDATGYPPPRPRHVALITNALCYSATDIFAAGFQDHSLGKILGVHTRTGAGGANVWNHSLLTQLTQRGDDGSSPFQALPHGANFTVAIRRMLRVGIRAGVPLEDLGVQPDALHHMTKDDLMHSNRDLIGRAIRLIMAEP